MDKLASFGREKQQREPHERSTTALLGDGQIRLQVSRTSMLQVTWFPFVWLWHPS